MLGKCLLASLVAAFVLGAVGMVCARQEITAKLSADPVSYAGPCPTSIKFEGSITVTEAGRVQYKFARSDGAFAPIQTLRFEKPGTKEVSTTWTLGGPGLPSYSGWQSIQVVYPMDLESNKAGFTIQCKQPPKITARLAADPASYKGPCPVTIKFRGAIAVTEAGKVQFRFIRSDGASAPVQTLIFAKPGTKVVGTTWTLGDAALPKYTGWEAIKIIYPTDLESKKASFKIEWQKR